MVLQAGRDYSTGDCCRAGKVSGGACKFEQDALEAMLPTLRADIELGEKFING